MSKPIFTVLMPTWNRDWTIQNAIQSIIDQTMEDWELLIIDDGSTDMTKQIINRFKDKRIRYESLGKHRGLVYALEAGNNLAGGEIIVKQDSDDISFPNRLEVILEKIKDNELFYHSIYKVWQDKDSPDVVHRTWTRAQPLTNRILKEQYIPGAFAYTRKFSFDVPYRFLYCSEDWMLLIDAFLKKKKFGFTEETLYDLLLRPDSNSMIHEKTGHYEEDEQAMKTILYSEYGINNFKYAKRT